MRQHAFQELQLSSLDMEDGCSQLDAKWSALRTTARKCLCHRLRVFGGAQRSTGDIGTGSVRASATSSEECRRHRLLEKIEVARRFGHIVRSAPAALSCHACPHKEYHCRFQRLRMQELRRGRKHLVAASESYAAELCRT